MKIEKDSDGRVLQKTSYEYDLDGNQCAVSREIETQKCTYTTIYDAVKRPIEKKDPLGNTTTIRYESGNPSRKITTSPKGIITTSLLDAYDREIERTVHDSSLTTLSHVQKEYDAQGNLLKHHDLIYHNGALSRIQTIAYTYTDRNKVHTVTRADGTANARTTQFCYYPSGRIAKKIKPDGLILNYSYDVFGKFEALGVI